MKRKRIRLDRKIKFTNKKHSLLGALSTLVGLVAFGFLFMSFYIAYISRGTAGENVGALGGAALFVGLLGFFLGMFSLKNKEVFYTFSWIGIILNMIVWVFMFCIFLIGV